MNLTFYDAFNGSTLKDVNLKGTDLKFLVNENLKTEFINLGFLVLCFIFFKVFFYFLPENLRYKRLPSFFIFESERLDIFIDNLIKYAIYTKILIYFFMMLF